MIVLTQKTCLAVLELEVLVRELSPINRLSTSPCHYISILGSRFLCTLHTITLCEVSTLDHERLDDTMEG